MNNFYITINMCKTFQCFQFFSSNKYAYDIYSCIFSFYRLCTMMSSNIPCSFSTGVFFENRSTKKTPSNRPHNSPRFCTTASHSRQPDSARCSPFRQYLINHSFIHSSRARSVSAWRANSAIIHAPLNRQTHSSCGMKKE